MMAYFRLSNREFRLQMQRPAADARYQWYVAAGMSWLELCQMLHVHLMTI
jgi:hypothetical protein